MSTRNLDKLFAPKSIALIGASPEEGVMGHTLMKNLLGRGYEGVVYPVNRDFESILGVHSYDYVSEIPRKVDLALLAIEDDDVETMLEDCVEAGVCGAIVYTSELHSGTFGVSRSSLDTMLENLSREYGMRILGPNSVGFIRPTHNINAGIYQVTPPQGSIAFISQSNAIFPALLDWADYKEVGFSSLVSVGSMVDVTFADLLDYFGMDPKTRSIMLYMEALCEFKEFMSAARHYARTKPIIVVKSAKFQQSALAAESHTGTLTTNDDLYDAAFRRAGILRVREVQELFDCSHALSSQPRPLGPKFAILTNSGGPGIMCADKIIERGGELVELTEESISGLDRILGDSWSRSNPVTVRRNISPGDMKEALEVLIGDRGIQGVVVVFGGTSAEQATGVAEAIVDVSRNLLYKPVLTTWMGREIMREGRDILKQGRIPTFSLPEKAADTLTYMHEYERNLRDLYETPEDILHGFESEKGTVKEIFRKVAAEGRGHLTEHEALRVLKAYGIRTVETRLVNSLEECLEAGREIGYPIVLKIVSPQILHKSDVGGVELNISTEDAARKAYEQIIENVKRFRPEADIEGVLVQPMISGQGYEVIVGLKWDPCFGPAILFGAGGIMVELIEDRSIGFPPLNQVLARRLISDTKMDSVLDGFYDRPPAAKGVLEETMVKISYLAIDFPEIMEMDINPIYIDDQNLQALDSVIVIDPGKVEKEIPLGSELIIGLYPTKFNKRWRMEEGSEVRIRPIRPEDEPRWRRMIESLSEASMRNRFFAPIQNINRDMVVRYCHVDYDREMALTANVDVGGEEIMIGTARLIREPDRSKAEFAVLVTDDFQRKGVGSRLLDTLIEIGKEWNIETIRGDVLKDNEAMCNLCAKKDFIIARDEEDEDIVHLVLEL